MKINRKGKIHPSPPQPQVAASSNSEDSLAVLNLLPAAILALVAFLSLRDREVVAYLITRSLKTTTTNSINCSSPSAKQSRKLYTNDKQMKSTNGRGTGSYHHQTAVFDCGCFECYTSFWLRWDSSPNRELIHQAIESFEEHLANGELQTKQRSNRRTRKKEKLPVQKLEKETPVGEVDEFLHFDVSEKEAVVNMKPEEVVEEEVRSAVVRAAAGGHKGFARKVLPDVLGVFNSRLWNLWGPNV